MERSLATEATEGDVGCLFVPSMVILLCIFVLNSFLVRAKWRGSVLLQGQ